MLSGPQTTAVEWLAFVCRSTCSPRHGVFIVSLGTAVFRPFRAFSAAQGEPMRTRRSESVRFLLGCLGALLVAACGGSTASSTGTGGGGSGGHSGSGGSSKGGTGGGAVGGSSGSGGS